MWFLWLATAFVLRGVDADLACKTEVDKYVTWTSNKAASFVVSNPMCLSHNGLVQKRNCSNGLWVPKEKPVCKYLHPWSVTVDCPSHWTKVSSASNETAICAKFETTKAWSNACATYGGSQKTFFDLGKEESTKLLKFALNRGYTDVWLPGKWINADTIQWMMPGKTNRTQKINHKLIRQNPKSGSGCTLLSVENGQFYLSNVDCNEDHAMLCLSMEPTQMLQLACPAGYRTSQKNDEVSWCHTLVNLTNSAYSPLPNHTLFEMSNVNVLNVPRDLLSDQPEQYRRCAFNPTFSNVPRFYHRSDFESEKIYKYQGFVNWRYDTDFNVEPDSYLVCDQNSRWFFSSQATSAIWSMQMELQLPSLGLNLSADLRILHLHVHGARFVWQERVDDAGVSCFRKEGTRDFRVDVERSHVTKDDKASFKVSVLQPGIYRCEAYAIRLMTLVQTSEVFIDRSDEFVVTATVDSRKSIHSFFQILQNRNAIFWLSEIQNRTSEKVPGTNGNFTKFRFRAYALLKSAHQLDDKERVLRKINLLGDMLNKIADSHHVSSTRFCLPVYVVYCNVSVEWPITEVGRSVTSNATTQVLLKTCKADKSERIANWDFDDQPGCNEIVPQLTMNLEQINKDFLGNVTNVTVFMDEVFTLIANQSDDLDPVQMLLLSNIMNKTSQQPELTKNTTIQTLDIYDRIMKKPTQNDVGLPPLSVTNDLLSSFESTVTKLSDEQYSTKNFKVITLDPREKNYSGICLLASGEVKLIMKNQSIDQMFRIPNLRVATFIPEWILDMMPHLTKVVFTIIHSDYLYQQSPDNPRLIVDSEILRVHLPNVESFPLPKPIPVFFKYNPSADGRSWSSVNHHNVWEESGINQMQTDTSTSIVRYEASFLTASFALLITEHSMSRSTQQNLTWISVVGGILSLTGILLIFLTAICFHKWATKASNVLLLELSFAIGALLVLLLFVMPLYHKSSERLACSVVGAILHYNVLVIFVWMLIMSYLQFVRYVIVFGSMHSSTFILKISLVCWGLPVVPVVVTFLTSPESYVRISGAGQQVCFATGLALVYGVIVPVGLIVMTNLAIYIRIIVNLVNIKHKSRLLLLNQLRVSVLLFFLLGMPWLFGLLIHLKITETVGEYLFCIFGTLQGFVLFLNCILLDRETRLLWTQWCGCKMAPRGYRNTSEESQEIILS